MIFELHSFWGNQNFLSNMWDHFTNAHALWENDSFPTVYRPVSRMPNGLNLACAPHGRLWGWCRSQMWVTPASQRENQKEIDRSIVTPMYQNVLPADTKHLFHASTLLIWYMGVGRISTRLPSALLSTPGPGWFALCFRMSTSGPWVLLGHEYFWASVIYTIFSNEYFWAMSISGPVWFTPYFRMSTSGPEWFTLCSQMSTSGTWVHLPHMC